VVADLSGLTIAATTHSSLRPRPPKRGRLLPARTPQLHRDRAATNCAATRRARPPAAIANQPPTCRRCGRCTNFIIRACDGPVTPRRSRNRAAHARRPGRLDVAGAGKKMPPGGRPRPRAAASPPGQYLWLWVLGGGRARGRSAGAGGACPGGGQADGERRARPVVSTPPARGPDSSSCARHRQESGSFPRHVASTRFVATGERARPRRGEPRAGRLSLWMFQDSRAKDGSGARAPRPGERWPPPAHPARAGPPRTRPPVHRRRPPSAWPPTSAWNRHPKTGSTEPVHRPRVSPGLPDRDSVRRSALTTTRRACLTSCAGPRSRSFKRQLASRPSLCASWPWAAGRGGGACGGGATGRAGRGPCEGRAGRAGRAGALPGAGVADHLRCWLSSRIPSPKAAVVVGACKSGRGPGLARCPVPRACGAPAAWEGVPPPSGSRHP
jgi:hypothetical protein